MGEFRGKTLMEREVAVLATLANSHDGKFPFENRKVEFVAVAGSESHLRLGSYNDNADKNREVVSRDCGLFQISIPASKIGTAVEAGLRTESKDPDVYMPIALENA